MLYRFFNQSSVLTVSVFVVMAILLWLPSFGERELAMYYNPVSPLFNFCNSYLIHYGILAGAICVALVVLESLILNGILNEFDVLPKNSSMAAFIYILMVSASGEFIFFNPLLCSCFFLIPALGQLFKIYGKQDAFAPSFNAGLLISMASLCYFPAILVFPLVLISFFIYRQFAWREWFISFTGLILPYIFLATYYYWKGVLFFKYSEYCNSLQLLSLKNQSFDVFFYVQISFIGILVIISLMKIIGAYKEKQIRVRKVYSIIIWFLLFSVLLYGFSNKYSFPGYAFVFLPISCVLSAYLLLTKKNVLAEFLMILLSVIIVAGRFF